MTVLTDMNKSKSHVVRNQKVFTLFSPPSSHKPARLFVILKLNSCSVWYILSWAVKQEHRSFKGLVSLCFCSNQKEGFYADWFDHHYVILCYQDLSAFLKNVLPIVRRISRSSFVMNWSDLPFYTGFALLNAMFEKKRVIPYSLRVLL
jgi:hypothetical protein